jgi:hypothetical protein
MRSTRGFSLVFAALALLACTKVKDLKVVEDKTPLPRPADVMIEASLPSLAAIDGIKAYADKVKPGMGALVDSKVRYFVADVGGLSNLDGVKAGTPVWALVLNPKPKGERSVLLVSVGDEKKLRDSAKDAEVRIQDGRAVVGKKDAVDALAPYAFATLARQKAPEAATVTVFVPVLRAAFGKEIEDARKTLPAAMGAATANPGMVKILNTEMDGVMWMLDATDAFEVRLEASADDVNLELAAVPAAGKDLAAFVAAQKPADGALLAKLPAVANPSVVAAGAVTMGPFREQAAKLMVELMAQLLSLPASEPASTALTELFNSITGNFAVVAALDAKGMKMHELVGVEDAAKAMASMRTFATLLTSAKMPATESPFKITYSAWKGDKIDDVPVVGYVQTIDLSKATPEQLAAMKMVSSGTSVTMVGAWDDVMGMAMGGGADGAAMKETIAAARGKGPRFQPSPAMAQLFEASRKRGESFAAVMNFASFARMATGGDATAPTRTPGVVFALGFQGGRARLRFEVPSAHIREIQGLEP